LKCRWLRYSLPWQQLEPEPGQFNWEWSDERFAVAGELGLKFMVDLVHFGVPTWLPGAFADVDFPRSLERFAAAFGRRYNGHPAVPTVCPINEPLTTAFLLWRRGFVAASRAWSARLYDRTVARGGGF
jgi:beta-galactosidase GanA